MRDDLSVGGTNSQQMTDLLPVRDTGVQAVYPLLALAISLIAALPLLMGPGILNTRAGGDSLFLVQRTQQLVESLRGGDLPARWMPDGAYGLGYPFFEFYAALP